MMESFNKAFFYISDKLIKVFWFFNFIFIIGAIGANIYIFNMFKLIDDEKIDARLYIVFAVVSSVLIIVSQINKVSTQNLPLGGYLISAIMAVYFSYRLISFYNFNFYLSKNSLYLLLIAISLVLFLSINSILAYCFKYIFCSSYLKVKVVESTIVSLVLSFVTIIFIPSQSFFSNFSDYVFPYQLLLKAVILDFVIWVILGMVILPLLKKRYYYGIIYGLTGVILAIYCQYMFMNASIGTIDGTTYEWKSHVVLTVINSSIWILLIIIPILLGLIKQKVFRKVFLYINIFIGLIHVFTYVTILVSAEDMCYKYSAAYFTYDNQYRLATDDNIIVFILDAVDNSMVKELYDTKEGLFDKYKDFTIYTNTCSEYDYTSRSILQMLTNFNFDNSKNNVDLREMAWNTPSAVEYYNRLHKGGYMVEYYNMHDENSAAIVGKFDNAHIFNQEVEKPRNISYKRIRENVFILAKYTIFPNILKSGVGIEKLSFADVVSYSSSKGNYENDEFERELHLELAEMSKCVRYYHLDGAHDPNNNIETVEYCFNILARYMEQMKELNVYDNSTIIILADHGSHDYCETKGIESIKASTPMFMIKEANNSFDKIKLDNSPIYNRDIIPTILYLAGQYEENENDQKLFGATIYDYPEDELRTRVWYDRVRDTNYPMTGTWNTFYGFEFVGDTDELNRVVEKRENMTIYPVPIMHD